MTDQPINLTARRRARYITAAPDPNLWAMRSETISEEQLLAEIEETRLGLGLTMDQYARLLGVSISVLHRYNSQLRQLRGGARRSAQRPNEFGLWRLALYGLRELLRRTPDDVERLVAFDETPMTPAEFREAREGLGLNQVALSQLWASSDPSIYWRFEAGRGVITKPTLRRLAFWACRQLVANTNRIAA